MTRQPRFRRLALAPGDSINLDDARGTTLRVARGRLWVTQYGDPTDYVLEAGDTWTIERRGRTIVQAQRDALVDVVGPAKWVTVRAIARANRIWRKRRKLRAALSCTAARGACGSRRTWRWRMRQLLTATPSGRSSMSRFIIRS